MRGGHRLRTVMLACAIVLSSTPTHAEDRVAQLTKMLTTSSSDKTRLAAVAALTRLGDRRAVKPLVQALGDPNPQIRALAATALGRLGDKTSLPGLTTGGEDPDPGVREKMRVAASAVARANNLPNPFPVGRSDPGAPPPAAPAVAARAMAPGGGRAGFGRQGHPIDNRPNLYVTIRSSADDSPGKNDPKIRQQNAEIAKQTFTASFNSAPLVTTVAADAARWGLASRQLDLAVTKMDVAQRAGYVEIEAQLRLAISDGQGKMLSFLSGGAKVQVPARKFDARNLPNLRREALETAARGMFDKLLAHLRDRAQS
jgi:hypothetical protein